jgi:hypothetical protein
MLKSLMREVALAIQARSGLTGALLVWLLVMALAALSAFAFLCVAGYVWASLQLGAVFGGLAMAGVFILVALIAAAASALSRRRTRARAILERAARAQQRPSWLLDPKIVGVLMQAGRAVGWQRLIPIALVGLLAAQFARDYRQRSSADSGDESPS